MKKGTVAGNIGTLFVIAIMVYATGCATMRNLGIDPDKEAARIKSGVLMLTKAAMIKNGIPPDALPDDLLSDTYDAIAEAPRLIAIAAEAEKNVAFVKLLTDTITKYRSELLPAVLTPQPAMPDQPPTLNN
jgi:hypothetical protein